MNVRFTCSSKVDIVDLQRALDAKCKKQIGWYSSMPCLDPDQRAAVNGRLTGTVNLNSGHQKGPSLPRYSITSSGRNIIIELVNTQNTFKYIMTQALKELSRGVAIITQPIVEDLPNTYQMA